MNKVLSSDCQYRIIISEGVTRFRSPEQKSCPDFVQEVCEQDIVEKSIYQDGNYKVLVAKGEVFTTLRKKRGKISGFSKRSRLNLSKFLFSLTCPPEIFLTLTYPREFPESSRDWKKHLDAFAKRLARRFPASWFTWKLEPQKRGAPHFHLLGSFGQKKYPVTFLRQWVAQVWYEIVGSRDERHLRAGTQVDYVEGKSKIKAYVSKYLGKAFSALDLPGWMEPGRFWGKIGRRNFPYIDNLEIKLTGSEFLFLKRIVRRWLRSKGYKGALRYAHWIKRFDNFFLFIDCREMLRLLRFIVSGFDVRGEYKQGILSGHYWTSHSALSYMSNDAISFVYGV